MATTDGTLWNQPVNADLGTQSFTRTQSSTTAVNTAADILRVAKIPNNALFTGFWLKAADLDTNGSPTIALTVRVTDGTTTKNFVASSNVAQAGGLVYASSNSDSALGFVTDNDDYWVEVLSATGAATGAAGNVTVHCTYEMYSAA